MKILFGECMDLFGGTIHFSYCINMLVYSVEFDSHRRQSEEEEVDCYEFTLQMQKR